MESDKPRKPNWPALDGLRCLAVIAVMIYHADLRVAASGFAGVDVFFVLSGFLITALLLTERNLGGTVSLRAFYARRVLRLYPALVATALFVLVVALATQHHIIAIGEGVLAALFYVVNIWIDTGHNTIFLQHAWTLSLEEQFYLLWPPLFLVMAAWTRRRVWLIGTVALVVVIGLGALPLTGSEAAVRGTYFRASGLVMGCVLAWLVVRWRLQAPTWIGSIAGAALIALLFSPSPFLNQLLTSGLSPAALLTVPLILSLIRPDIGHLSLLLSGSGVRWIGRRSYGLYLWHFPILSLALHQTPKSIPHLAKASAGLLISFAVAAMSYRFVESPFLQRKRRFQRLPPAASLTLVTGDTE